MRSRRERGVGAGRKESMRFQWSCNCFLFYVGVLYCIVNACLMLLRLGPFAPPPPPKPWTRERDWVRTTTNPPFVMFVHPVSEDRYISLELFKYGVWEKPLHDRMLEVFSGASRNATLLDVGANIGFHALAIAAAGYKVAAVEPLPDNVALLRKSVAANGLEDLVEVYPVVASNISSRDVCIHSSSMNKGHTFVRPSSAINPFKEPPHAALVRRVTHHIKRLAGGGIRARAGESDGPSEEMVEDIHKERHFAGDCQHASATTIDSLLLPCKDPAFSDGAPFSVARRENPARNQAGDVRVAGGELVRRTGPNVRAEDVMVVKIDVEGFERFVLEGSVGIIDSSTPPCYFFIEIFPKLLRFQLSSPEALLDFMKARGYVLHPLGGEREEGLDSNPERGAKLEAHDFAEGKYAPRGREWIEDSQVWDLRRSCA
jgi:FkbM family methyltransferase